MKFAHGSKQKLEDFELFNYTIQSKNGKSDNDFINNGNDGEGAGIYAMIGQDEYAIKHASCYSGEEENEGYVYLLDVNVEEDQLMNLRSADEIPEEDWIEGIDAYMSEIRHIKGMSKEIIFETITSFEENFENAKLEDIQRKFENRNLNFKLEEYNCPSEFEFFSDWEDSIQEQYDMEDPCAYIIEEGLEGIVEHSIEISDNLYDTLCNIWNRVACSYTSQGIEKNNETFQKQILRTVGRNHNLTAAFVDNDNFAVIFDTYEISIDKIIDFKAEYEMKNDVENLLNQKENNKSLEKKKTPKR